MSDEEKKYYWTYGVTVYGIKKRCRKIERHIGGDRQQCSIGRAKGEPTKEEATPLAKQWIREHMKVCDKAYATATKWEDLGNGMASTRLLDDAWNMKWEIFGAW
jgi:hypothetical protein